MTIQSQKEGTYFLEAMSAALKLDYPTNIFNSFRSLYHQTTSKLKQKSCTRAYYRILIQIINLSIISENIL